MDYQLSTNFWLSEFLKSRKAVQLGISLNDPPTQIVINLTALANVSLQPARTIDNTPYHIVSGWRPPRVNAGVGGVPGNQHERGEAADLWAEDRTPFQIARVFVDNQIPFDQLIIYPAKNTCHVSFTRLGVNRGEVLTKYPSTGYLRGIVER